MKISANDVIKADRSPIEVEPGTMGFIITKNNAYVNEEDIRSDAYALGWWSLSPYSEIAGMMFQVEGDVVKDYTEKGTCPTCKKEKELHIAYIPHYLTNKECICFDCLLKVNQSSCVPA